METKVFGHGNPTPLCAQYETLPGKRIKKHDTPEHEARKADRRSLSIGDHTVLIRQRPRNVERVRPHTDPIRELLGEPAPGQSALDKRNARTVNRWD